MKNILSIVLFLSLHPVSAQTELSALEHLFMTSDLVIQGVVIPRPCNSGVGYENCSWTVELDSIYKGNPKIDSIQDYTSSEGYYRGDTFFTPNVASVHYCMRLGHNELKPERGQSIVVFLREATWGKLTGSSDNRFCYTLVDRYKGWLPSNFSLSEKLSKLKSAAQK